MDNWQLLLSKVIDFGNLLSSLSSRVDRNAEDIRRIFDYIKPMGGQDLDSRIKSLESYHNEDTEQERARAITRPNKVANTISIVSVTISALLGAVTLYVLLHHTH